MLILMPVLEVLIFAVMLNMGVAALSLGSKSNVLFAVFAWFIIILEGLIVGPVLWILSIPEIFFPFANGLGEIFGVMATPILVLGFLVSPFYWWFMAGGILAVIKVVFRKRDKDLNQGERIVFPEQETVREDDQGILQQ